MYVGGLCPINDTITQGEDLGRFLMYQMHQISKKPEVMFEVFFERLKSVCPFNYSMENLR